MVNTMNKEYMQDLINDWIEYDWCNCEIILDGVVYDVISEEFPEDNTANFIITNTDTEEPAYWVSTIPVFENDILVSATVDDIANPRDYA